MGYACKLGKGGSGIELEFIGNYGGSVTSVSVDVSSWLKSGDSVDNFIINATNFTGSFHQNASQSTGGGGNISKTLSNGTLSINNIGIYISNGVSWHRVYLSFQLYHIK